MLQHFVQRSDGFLSRVEDLVLLFLRYLVELVSILINVLFHLLLFISEGFDVLLAEGVEKGVLALELIDSVLELGACFLES